MAIGLALQGKIQFRRGTAAEWTSANPVLLEGEMGVETDTNKFKIGNGVGTWTALSYGGLVGPAVTVDAVPTNGSANAVSSDGVFDALALKAPLADAALTGNPTVPTQTAGNNSTRIANTAFVTTAMANAIAGLVNSSPAALDTLNELAAALGNDANFATTVTNALATKFDRSGGILAGLAGSGVAQAAGKVFFDTDFDTMSIDTSIAGVRLQVGQEQWIRVRNVSGSTIPNGAAVYISGANSGLPTVALARSDTLITAGAVAIATHAIANNTNGVVTAGGQVNGLDTSAYAVGTTLYLSETVAGGYQTTVPAPPSFRVQLGKVTAQNASTGSIHVQVAAAVSGLHFNVVSDGGADPTGTNDCAAIINAAIALVGAAGGGIVFFPKGTYKINSGITMAGNFVTLRGVSRVSSKIQRNFATGNTITSTGIFNRVETMRLEGTNSTLVTSGYGFSASAAASNNSCQWVDIIYHWSGVQATGQLCRLEDMNIREMGANAPNGCIVLIDSFTDQVLRAIVSDNPTNPTGFAGFRITNLSSLIVTNCQIIHCGNGFDLVPSSTNTIPSIFCANTFFDQGFIGLNVVPGSGTVNRCKFTQVWFSGNSIAGVRLNGVNINGVDLLGCDIYGNPIGIEALSATNWSVRNSRLAGNTSAAIRTTAGATHSFVIADNDLGNSGGFGANALGVDVQAGTYKRYQIIDNRGLETNTTPGITDNGVVGPQDFKTVQNNLGTLVNGPLPLLSSGGAAVIAGRGAVTSGTGETLLATVRIPANAVGVGQMFRINAILQSSSTGTFIGRIRVGAAGTTADTAVAAHAATVAGTAGSFVQVEGFVYVAALGASATVGGYIRAGTSGAVVAETAEAAELLSNAPTTAPWFITLTGTASAGTYTVRAIAIQAI